MKWQLLVFSLLVYQAKYANYEISLQLWSDGLWSSLLFACRGQGLYICGTWWGKWLFWLNFTIKWPKSSDLSINLQKSNASTQQDSAIKQKYGYCVFTCVVTSAWRVYRQYFSYWWIWSLYCRGSSFFMANKSNPPWSCMYKLNLFRMWRKIFHCSRVRWKSVTRYFYGISNKI